MKIRLNGTIIQNPTPAQMAALGREMKEGDEQAARRLNELYQDPRYQGPQWTWTGTGWVRSEFVAEATDWPVS
jgi:hypothetical protein